MRPFVDSHLLCRPSSIDADMQSPPPPNVSGGGGGDGFGPLPPVPCCSDSSSVAPWAAADLAALLRSDRMVWSGLAALCASDYDTARLLYTCRPEWMEVCRRTVVHQKRHGSTSIVGVDEACSKKSPPPLDAARTRIASWERSTDGMGGTVHRLYLRVEWMTLPSVVAGSTCALRWYPPFLGVLRPLRIHLAWPRSRKRVRGDAEELPCPPTATLSWETDDGVSSHRPAFLDRIFTYPFISTAKTTSVGRSGMMIWVEILEPLAESTSSTSRGDME